MAQFCKPITKNVDKLPVRLVLCIDGTGDTATGSFNATTGAIAGGEDSIRTIFNLTQEGVVTDPTGKKAFQFVQYFEGVGTVGAGADAGVLTKAVALFDAATGYGYLDIIRNVYKVCCRKLQHGDQNEIFIFGFSRGAFIARALASFLQYVGLIKEEFLDKDEKKEDLFKAKFHLLLARYRDLTKKPLFGTKPPMTSRSKDLLPFCMPAPHVRLVGAFDTVKTVIPLPITNSLFNKMPSVDFEMDAPGIVDHFRHALALNESRTLFTPDLWKADASTGSSYLEAWFFGFHHDIGGGDDVQGLALWPLQWILHAAREFSLVLDPSVDPYDTLFAGEDNIVETPLDIAMQMFDMIQHHTTGKWGLRLNEPHSYLEPNPRNYFQYLTALTSKLLPQSKVFLHPSAYLIFDVSSAFRIQVYGWRYFRSFLRDRYVALPQTTVPWWEKQTVASILKEFSSVRHLNLLVYGRAGTGKSAMIGALFGKVVEVPDRDINTPLSIPGNARVRVYSSDGFGKTGNDDRASVERFLTEHATNTDIESQIHAVWYFHDCSDPKIASSDKEFLSLEFGDIPVMVILKNEEKLKDAIREDAVGADAGVADLDALAKFNAAIEKKKKDMDKLKDVTYIQARNKAETPKNLLKAMTVHIHTEAIQIALIKAQRIEVKPMIALATEESIRAYAIWHSFTFGGGKKIKFNRSKDPDGEKLSAVLMEPVLGTFNIRFPGDTALILSKIGSTWSTLDKYKPTIWDETIPADLILLCTIDTIIVMTHALCHQQVGGKVKVVTDYARPLSAADIESACAWYTAPKQNIQIETHARIRSLLAADFTPKDKSMASLQMKIIETVELQSGMAESAAGFVARTIANIWAGKGIFA